MDRVRSFKVFKSVLVLITIVSVIIVASGCSDSNTKEESKATVVTSFYPLEFIVQELSGNDFEVVNVTPAGAEPHDLELNAKTTGQLLDADLAIVLGNGFQPAVEKTAESRDGKTLEILTALKEKSEGAFFKPVSLTRPTHDGEDHGSKDEADAHVEEEKKIDENDPHVWLDPKEMSSVVAIVADELAKIKPENKKTYKKNQVAFIAKLSKLDTKYKEALATCEIKTFVTSHDAFSRLAYRYGLSQESIAGVSPENEPTAAKLKELSELVKEKKIEYIFTEELVSKKVAETLSKQAGVKTEVLSPIEGLTQEQAKSGETYFTLMESNLDLLSRALRCSTDA
jgi:zinc transport system substrate-binding protein